MISTSGLKTCDKNARCGRGYDLEILIPAPSRPDTLVLWSYPKIGGRMKIIRLEIDDERDTSFELPDSYFETLKPGFIPAEKERKEDVSEGDYRFPRISDEKDVPQEPLARRLRKPE